MKYRADIDGLRGLAIAVVLLFHAGLHNVRGGFLGVDVFFVISGYLICSIVLKEIDEGRFSFAGFFERRVRRLAPALMPVLLFSLAASSALSSETQFADFLKSFFATVGLSANWYFLSTVGYFDPAAETRPLLHMWSLGVEEQFYLLFPALLVFIAARKRETLPLCIGALGMASFIYFVALRGAGHTETAFFSTIARAWQLLIGASLAMVAAPSFTQRRHEAIEITGLLLIVLPVLWAHTARYAVMGSSLAVIGAALLIWSGGKGRIVSGFLKSRPMVILGLISYSLYLWHWPLLAWVSTAGGSSGMRAAALLISVALAGLSFVLVETPFRQRTVAQSRFALMGWYGGAVLALCVIAANLSGIQQAANAAVWAVYYGKDKATALRALSAAEATYMETLDLNFTGADGEYDPSKHRGWTCSYDKENTVERVKGCLVQQLGGSGVLVIGDSIGRDTLHALRKAFPSTNFVMLHESGCAPADFSPRPQRYCFRGMAKLLAEISASAKVRAVVVAFNFWPDTWREVAPTLDLTRELFGDVALIAASPTFSRTLSEVVKDASPTPPLELPKSFVDWDMNAMVAEAGALARARGADFIDVYDFFCGAQACPIWLAGDFAAPLYWDQRHLTPRGIDAYAKYLTGLPSLAHRFGKVSAAKSESPS